MRVKKIFIHVGAGKTGTTALQTFLKLNEKALEERGVHLPSEGRVGGKEYLAHHGLSGWGAHSKHDPMPKWRAIERSDSLCVVVSSEYFHNRISGPGGEAFFQSVREIFCDWQLKIVFYIRRQEQWIQSVYEQWIKSGTLRTGEAADEFALRYKNNLPDQIRRFEKIFGHDSIIVKPYERSQLKNSDIVDDFLQVILPDAPALSSEERGRRNANPRLSMDALEFKRIFNSVCDTVEETRLISGELVDYSREKFEAGAIFSEHELLSPSVANAIELSMEEKYRSLAVDFLDRDDGKLFFEEYSPKPHLHPAAQSDYSNVVAFLLKRVLMRLQKLESVGSK